MFSSSSYSFKSLLDDGATSSGPSLWNRCTFRLSARQRLVCFAVCFGSGLSCFLISTMYIPFLMFKARKFCIFFTVASLLVMGSFAFLFGPASHLKHTFSRERAPFTLTYLLSLLITLYVSFQLQSTALTVLFAIVQVLSLIWYFVSYLPHGHSAMKYFATMFTRTVANSLPV